MPANQISDIQSNNEIVATQSMEKLDNVYPESKQKLDMRNQMVKVHSPKKLERHEEVYLSWQTVLSKLGKKCTIKTNFITSLCRVFHIHYHWHNSTQWS